METLGSRATQGISGETTSTGLPVHSMNEEWAEAWEQESGPGKALITQLVTQTAGPSWLL